MDKKYILGVDGGNTKTDYFLFANDGEFIDFYRDGTCSHEGLSDSFDGSFRVMSKAIMKILEKNNLTVPDICAAVFGLAGVDTPYQKQKLEEVVTKIGFQNFRVVNDSFLGIKAVSEVGVCSICGTGTSAGGIDLKGNYLQVGGIGAIVGDEAGGSWLARRAIRQTFDALYRFDQKSLINQIVLDELQVKDKYYLMEAISERLGKRLVDLTKITKAVFECANLGDQVCIDLLKEMANNLARSAGGCVSNLELGDHPLVVLAGSVWVKGSNPTLVNEFKKLINQYTQKECNVIILTVPPATGAIIWALELASGSWPCADLRHTVTNAVIEKLSSIEGSKC